MAPRPSFPPFRPPPMMGPPMVGPPMMRPPMMQPPMPNTFYPPQQPQQWGPRPGASPPVDSRPCRDFLLGQCTRINCKFSHTHPHAPAAAPPRPIFTPPAYPPRPPFVPQPVMNGTCRDFLLGKCTRTNCRFSHGAAAPMPGMTNLGMVETRMCRDFLEGRCTRTTCRFSHSPAGLRAHLQ